MVLVGKASDLGLFGPGSINKLDYNIILYRAVDRTDFLLSIALQQGDSASQDSASCSNCFALKNSIAAVEALFLAKGLRSVESYWPAKEKALNPPGQKAFSLLEELAMSQGDYTAGQRLYVSRLVDWFALLMESMPKLHLIKKGVDASGRRSTSGKESD